MPVPHYTSVQPKIVRKYTLLQLIGSGGVPCRKKMRAGTIVAGVIVFFLGLAGLAELFGEGFLPFSLAIVSAYLTRFGALVLFGVIAIIGLGLMIGGAVSEGPEVAVAREVVVAEPLGTRVIYETLSDLELTILRYLSQGKTEREISNTTGVAHSTISEKVAILRARGYITPEKNTLTEKGFEALRQTEPIPPRPPQ
jgi:membrane-bound ClpP family serine protease